MNSPANAGAAGAAVHASSVLVVDDEPDLLTLYELTLLREGLEVETAATVAQAREILQSRVFRAVISDMRLPDGTGLDLLRWLEESGRPEKVIVVTAYGSPENAVTALKAGAFDYLTKPVDLRQFRAVVASAMGRTRATPPPPPTHAEPADLRGDPLRRLVGESDTMAHVRSLVEKVARSMAPVLVQGESGTGKELVARAIHDVSARAGQPFVAVNCGAIPETLLESEFFGVRKGAFTGANADRDGFFQAANGGTLFLDEIGDLPFAMQSKLLRAIQERAVRAIGATTEQTLNVRIVSATHKDLAAEVQAGRFRQDLFYRLNVIDIKVPPLRDRLADLPAIADALLSRIAREAGVSPAPRLADDARTLLARYGFPGNVRELENLLHRAVALSDGEVILPHDLALPEALLTDASPHAAAPADPDASVIAAIVVDHARAGLTVAEAMGAGAMAHADAAPPAAQEPVPDDLARYLDEVERTILVRALERQNFNRTAAGASLGLSLRQMRYRMARLGITESETSDPELIAVAAGEWERGWWRDATCVASPNFSERPAGARVDTVVLHSISLPPGEYGGDGIRRLFTNTLDWSAHPYFETIRGLEVSAHFVVRRDGEVLQFVSIDDRAWHAGRSSFEGREAANDWSIGIELEGLEGDTFEPAQYAALERLLPAIDHVRGIRHVVGHEHVAPGRKIDPGPGFDWHELAARLRWDARRIPPAGPRQD